MCCFSAGLPGLPLSLLVRAVAEGLSLIILIWPRTNTYLPEPGSRQWYRPARRRRRGFLLLTSFFSSSWNNCGGFNCFPPHGYNGAPAWLRHYSPWEGRHLQVNEWHFWACCWIPEDWEHPLYGNHCHGGCHFVVILSDHHPISICFDLHTFAINTEHVFPFWQLDFWQLDSWKRAGVWKWKMM